MSAQAQAIEAQDMTATPKLTDLSDDALIALAGDASAAADRLIACAETALKARIAPEGRVSGKALEAEQWAAHCLAWAETYGESLRQMAAWAVRIAADGAFGEMERLILHIGVGEYLAQLSGGVMMSQGEFARPADMGVSAADITAFTSDPAVARLSAEGATDAAKIRLVALMRDAAGSSTFGACGLDEEFEMVRDQFRRFAEDRVVPFAHEWHLKDELIPMELIEEMAELGVFGLTIPEEHGDVRRLGRAVPRLYRRRLAGHTVRDRRRADPRRRHRRTEGRVAAETRQRRDPADRRLHRTEHRLRPRVPAHPRGAAG
jgi:hypothetical protein